MTARITDSDAPGLDGPHQATSPGHPPLRPSRRVVRGEGTGGCCSAQVLFFAGYLAMLGLIVGLVLLVSGLNPGIVGWAVISISPLLAFVPPLALMYLIFALGLVLMVKAAGPPPAAREEPQPGEEDRA